MIDLQRRQILTRPWALAVVAVWAAALGLPGHVAAQISAPDTARASDRLAPMVLPVAVALQTELAAALKAGQPLVLMISLDGCPYCKIARENYLAPLVREHGLRVVQINMQHREAVKDLQGRDTTQAQLIADLKVSVAPTLLFYGRAGLEVAPRLEGMSSLDFYGAYLEQRVQTARQAVKN